ncbi:hypothetical protein GQX73_g6098 [Xylaria multiplex]|uniref:Uncharacterized protein n=1 Tax=Xylaria multiplex TaxID=323545 RepID=A0A7C8IMJ1_9PEZI|nr:hypothetical protein GQX73_g6098 [Xylaria multiplex]
MNRQPVEQIKRILSQEPGAAGQAEGEGEVYRQSVDEYTFGGVEGTSWLNDFHAGEGDVADQSARREIAQPEDGHRDPNYSERSYADGSYLAPANQSYKRLGEGKHRGP